MLFCFRIGLKMERINLKRLLRDFEVTTEDELQQKLYNESLTIPCAICKREFEFDKLSFATGDGICLNCLLQPEMVE